MTFDTRERSVATGRPLRLYEFQRGTKRWFYGSADRDLTLQTRLWRSTAISDDGVRLTGETTADVLKVTAPGTLEVAQLYRAAPPSADVGLTVRDFHEGEADLASNVRVVWVGSISGVRFPQPDRCEITCESLSASMDRPGLRLTWERTCPHTLFDRNCGKNRDLYAVSAQVQTLTGAAISSGTFAGFPNGYFSGGLVEWSVGDGEIDRRCIEYHFGSEVFLLGGTQGLVGGMDLKAFPGCRQTDTYCDGTFDNLANFGGVKHLPGKSPFDGTPVF
jgi:uncharacterized phage protein (TIGR02218 family)